MYILGRDRCFRPNLYLDIRKMKEDKLVADEVLQLVTFLNIYIIQHMFIPGQVHNLNMIIDIGKLGIVSFPSKIIKACLGSLKNNFRDRGLCRY